MRNFNKTHPELREGEVFFANISVEPGPDTPLVRLPKVSLAVIGYKTKRLGQIAYSPDGTPLGEYDRPVFVQKRELLDNGVDPDKLNPDILPD